MADGPGELEQRVLQLFENAIGMELRLSEDDSDYKLTFITQKLAQVSTYIEKLSDIQMQLTRIALEVTRAAQAHKKRLQAQERTLKGSDEYAQTSREQKSLWLHEQLQGLQDTADEWTSLATVVSEVRQAVSDRAQTMKRLDSDIRLQAKMYEQKLSAGAGGATSSTAYTGPKNEELDIE